MTVYIEIVLIDNFAITFLLGKLSYRIISEYPNYLRLCIASIVGTVAAVFYPFIQGAVWLILYKVAVGISIVLLLFRPRKLLRGAVVFLLLTFAFGGALFAMGYFIYGSVEKALTEPFLSLPIGAILFFAYLIFLIIKRIVRKLKKSRDVSCYMFDAEILMLGKNIRCKAFLDSGNRLYDEKNGLPIVVASANALSRALTDEQMAQLFTGKIKFFKSAHYIDYVTIGGKSKMLVFKPDGLVVYNKDKKNIISDVMIGVSFKRISDAESYELILNPAMMTGVKLC